MKNHLRKTAASLIIAIMISSFPLNIQASQKTESGTVRILLTDLQLISRIDIGIFGSYLMNDNLSFQSGSQLIVTENQNGLMIYYEGARIQGSKSIVLKRYDRPNDTENGLRINNKLNLYEGDLIITQSDQGLRVILHIGIEDYLKGVVPYEMSDSFPFEALKAQAIAARSYTLRGLRSDRDYDLTDDTNDQVFKGFIKENKQAILAVQKTEGVVLTYKDNIARTYYTASNGGQTESSSNAWGSEDTAYLSVREDPYDEENPANVVREFKIPKLWKADSQQAIEFEILLKTAIAQKIALLGYDTDLSYTQIDKIINISASTPKYSDQSRLMTQLSLTLAVSGRRKNSKIQENEISLFAVETNKPTPSVTPYTQESWGPVEMIDEPIKLTIDIFPQIERILGLSINVKENEIIQVLDGKEEFILRSSRYGHGVGMSQRGAEWMAKHYGKNSSDILSFYYPGTEQKLFVTNPATRPALELDFLTTPGPIPTATPRPTLVPQSSTPAPDQWQIIITGISQNSSLNLRLLPNLSGEVIGQLYYGQHLLVLERAADEWLHVRADGIEGYVMESFVEKLP